MNAESVFLRYIRQVLRRWTGLQLAIEEGMGGIYGREKEIWFGTEIENFFKNNDDLYPNEVEDFMAVILDGEFDTIAEDESLVEISKDLCKVFDLVQAGGEQEVLSRISQKASVPAATNASIADCEVVNEVEEQTPLTSQIEQLTVRDQPEAVSSDGWTEVRRGKKKK